VAETERPHAWVLPSRPKAGDYWKSEWSCSNCSVYASQRWTPLFYQSGYGDNESYSEYQGCAISKCEKCGFRLVWFGDVIVYPRSNSAEQPHPDLPTPSRDTFLEAGNVLDASPRAAAALLRLALEELCVHLGKKGDLNTMIGHLVQEGLRPQVQQALDVVRVSGNKAVHPGTIDPGDGRDQALAMFDLINDIAEELIARPKHVGAMYDHLPESIRGEIEKRDKKKPPTQPV